MKKLYVVNNEGRLYFDEVESKNFLLEEVIEHLYRFYDCVDYEETDDCIFLYTRDFKRNEKINNILK
jgi:hypothetical protein